MRLRSWTLLCLAILFVRDHTPDPFSRSSVGSPPVLLVTAAGASAHSDLRSAVAAARDSDTVVLADGVYSGPGNRDIEVESKSITIRSSSGDPRACIIQVGGRESSPHRAFVFRGDAAGMVLEGVSLTGGWADYGAAVLCSGSSPIIRNCLFDRNRCRFGGALCCLDGGSPRVADCVFRKNVSLAEGAAAVWDCARPVFTRCTFVENRARGNGAAVSGTTVGRTSPAPGAPRAPRPDRELLATEPTPSPVFRNCTFVRNRAGRHGKPAVSRFCSPRFDACVFAFNIPCDGLYGNSFAYPEISDCCFYNCGVQDPESFVTQQMGINGNFVADPLLVEPWEPAGFGIRPDSPCAPTEDRPRLIGAWPVRGKAAGRNDADTPSSPGDRPDAPNVLEARRRFWEVRGKYSRLRNQAWAAEIDGSYVEAEACFRELVALLRRTIGANHALCADAIEDLAYVLFERGNLGEADQLYAEAQRFRRRTGASSASGLGENLIEQAAVRLAQKRPEAAEALLREAVDTFESSPETAPSRARALRNLGEALLAQSRYGEAEPCLTRAIALFQEETRPRVRTDLALALRSLSLCLRARGHPEGAQRLLEQALRLQEDRFGEDHPWIAGTEAAIGDCSLEMERYAEAESLYNRAAGVFESVRLRAAAGPDRATFLDSPYQHLAAARLRRGASDQAWVAAERGQGRALGDVTLAAARRARSPRVSAREDSLRISLSDAEARVQGLQAAFKNDSAGAGTAALEDARTTVHEARAAWSLLQDSLTVRGSEGVEPECSLSRIQEALDDDVAVIGWVHVTLRASAPVTAGYVIRKSGPVHWVPLPGMNTEAEARDSEALINRFRNGLMAPDSRARRESSLDSVRTEGRRLWRQWLAPLLPACAGAERLVVVLSGPLLGVPLEALSDEDGEVVGERFAVSYVPSATMYSWLKSLDPIVPPGVGRRALLVGDPPFSARHLKAMVWASEHEGKAGPPASLPCGPEPPAPDAPPVYDESYLRSALSGDEASLDCLPRLPWTRVEVNGLSSLFHRATSLLGPAASEQALIDLARADSLRKYDTIHLATHALVDDDWPERSALVLSRVGLADPLVAAARGKRVCDGLVTATDIACEFRLRADLVTLSACRTAMGKSTPGDGYIGLASSFLQAGARSLLVSLWRVDDEATALLMKRFYENLTGSRADLAGKRLSKSRALQEARCWLAEYADADGVRRFRHPSCWAGFVLIGDDGREQTGGDAGLRRRDQTAPRSKRAL